MALWKRNRRYWTRFVVNGVSLTNWRAAGTMNGGELVSNY